MQPSFLPPPFERIAIPPGPAPRTSNVFDVFTQMAKAKGKSVTITGYKPTASDETINGPPAIPVFAILKYPITNTQYAEFVEAGGYQNRQWWTEAGWEALNAGWEWDPKREFFGEESSKRTDRAWKKPAYWVDQNRERHGIGFAIITQCPSPRADILRLSGHMTARAIAHTGWLTWRARYRNGICGQIAAIVRKKGDRRCGVVGTPRDRTSRREEYRIDVTSRGDPRRRAPDCGFRICRTV